jgi:Arc/MetJ-type ribon-helix-helix transcriptional regulator
VRRRSATTSRKSDLRVISLRIPRRELKELDKLVRKGLFKNRSEAIRLAIRKLLGEVVW